MLFYQALSDTVIKRLWVRSQLCLLSDFQATISLQTLVLTTLRLFPTKKGFSALTILSDDIEGRVIRSTGMTGLSDYWTRQLLKKWIKNHNRIQFVYLGSAHHYKFSNISRAAAVCSTGIESLWLLDKGFQFDKSRAVDWASGWLLKNMLSVHIHPEP